MLLLIPGSLKDGLGFWRDEQEHITSTKIMAMIRKPAPIPRTITKLEFFPLLVGTDVEDEA